MNNIFSKQTSRQEAKCVSPMLFTCRFIWVRLVPVELADDLFPLCSIIITIQAAHCFVQPQDINSQLSASPSWRLSKSVDGRLLSPGHRGARQSVCVCMCKTSETGLFFSFVWSRFLGCFFFCSCFLFRIFYFQFLCIFICAYKMK